MTSVKTRWKKQRMAEVPESYFKRYGYRAWKICLSKSEAVAQNSFQNPGSTWLKYKNSFFFSESSFNVVHVEMVTTRIMFLRAAYKQTFRCSVACVSFIPVQIGGTCSLGSCVTFSKPQCEEEA